MGSGESANLNTVVSAHMHDMYHNIIIILLLKCTAGADLGGGVQGVATPPNDFEQPLPLIYKAYYSLYSIVDATVWLAADKLCST